MLIALCEGSQQCASEAEAGGLAAAATALLSSSFPLLLRAVQQEDTVDVLGMTIEAIAGSTRACDEARGAGIALHFPPQCVTPAAEVLAKVLRGALARRAAAVLEQSRRRGSAGGVLAVDESAAAALLTMGMNEIEEAIRVEEQIFESVVESNSALARTLGARCVRWLRCGLFVLSFPLLCVCVLWTQQPRSRARACACACATECDLWRDYLPLRNISHDRPRRPRTTHLSQMYTATRTRPHSPATGLRSKRTSSLSARR